MKQTIMACTLDYSRPIVGRDSNAVDADLLPLAIYCGVAPLSMLIFTFLLWLPTHWLFLEFLGLWTIILGLVMFIVGGVCVVAYIPTALVAGDQRARVVLTRAAIATLLLFLNLVGAMGIFLAARAISPTLIGA